MNGLTESFESAQQTIAEFLRDTPEAIEITDYDHYKALMHDSGLVRAVATTIADHPKSSIGATSSYNHYLHIKEGRSEVYASTPRDLDNGLVRVSTFQLPPGVGPKERLSFISRFIGFGDMAVRSCLENEESYCSLLSRQRPSPAESLTSLLRLSRQTFERFARLTAV